MNETTWLIADVDIADIIRALAAAGAARHSPRRSPLPPVGGGARVPAHRGADVRPFHGVADIAEQRTTFALRQQQDWE